VRRKLVKAKGAKRALMLPVSAPFPLLADAAGGRALKARWQN
jgi:hypothetical protein